MRRLNMNLFLILVFLLGFQLNCSGEGDKLVTDAIEEAGQSTSESATQNDEDDTEEDAEEEEKEWLEDAHNPGTFFENEEESLGREKPKGYPGIGTPNPGI
ncbi:MAG: hypothetical protein H7A33_00490 [Deltaproteobacteria bacterium]|nr:hypothetical protein [Deltaproteobacteria bacterium]